MSNAYSAYGEIYNEKMMVASRRSWLFELRNLIPFILILLEMINWMSREDVSDWRDSYWPGLEKSEHKNN